MQARHFCVNAIWKSFMAATHRPCTQLISKSDGELLPVLFFACTLSALLVLLRTLPSFWIIHFLVGFFCRYKTANLCFAEAEYSVCCNLPISILLNQDILYNWHYKRRLTNYPLLNLKLFFLNLPVSVVGGFAYLKTSVGVLTHLNQAQITRALITCMSDVIQVNDTRLQLKLVISRHEIIAAGGDDCLNWRSSSTSVNFRAVPFITRKGRVGGRMGRKMRNGRSKSFALTRPH